MSAAKWVLEIMLAEGRISAEQYKTRLKALEESERPIDADKMFDVGCTVIVLAFVASLGVIVVATVAKYFLG